MEELALSTSQTASAEEVAQGGLIEASEAEVEVRACKEAAGRERIKIPVADNKQEVEETGGRLVRRGGDDK